MYVLPICLLIMAVVFLMIQIRYFLIHYKQASEVEPSKLNVYIYIYKLLWFDQFIECSGFIYHICIYP